MVNPILSPMIGSSSYFEHGETHKAESSMNTVQPAPNLQGQTSLDGPVAILWDIENCPVPSDVRAEDVAGNIRTALQGHPVIKGAVTVFSAYGDFNAFPRRLREGCQRTGVKLIDVPNGRKDAADKAILIDMFLFALDNPPPSSIMLISGDVDFSPALHVLGQRGYTVILLIPSRVSVSSALCNAGKFVWDWSSVARGEGFVPSFKALMPSSGGLTDAAGCLIRCHRNNSLDGQNDEESVAYGGIPQSYYHSRELSMCFSERNSTSVSNPDFSTNFRSQSLPAGLNDASGGLSCVDQCDSIKWVQPGDVNGLKAQLVKLLELSGGCMSLTRVPCDYQKMFGRPLYVSEYGVLKLVNLLKKMDDTMVIEGKGKRKFVFLRNREASPSAPPLCTSENEKKGKAAQEENTGNVTRAATPDDFSDEERTVVEEAGRAWSQGKNAVLTAAQSKTYNNNLEQFKCELQDILVSYACPIFLGCFEEIYFQRYKKPVEYGNFGVNHLEGLFGKVQDIVVMLDEPNSNRKFIAAAGG